MCRRVDMCIDMCIGVCIAMYIDMCIDMCMYKLVHAAASFCAIEFEALVEPPGHFTFPATPLLHRAIISEKKDAMANSDSN